MGYTLPSQPSAGRTRVALPRRARAVPAEAPARKLRYKTVR